MTIYITLINYGDFVWPYKSTFIHNHKQNTTEHEANRMLISSVNVYAVRDAKCRSSVYQWHIHTHTCQQTRNVCCADLICSECITGFALQCCSELFDVHLNTTCKVLQSATRQKHQWITAEQQTESHTCTTLQREDKVNLEAYKIPTIQTCSAKPDQGSSMYSCKPYQVGFFDLSIQSLKCCFCVLYFSSSLFRSSHNHHTDS